MSPAPSEKHLEDWIVANFNRFGMICSMDWYSLNHFPNAYLINDYEFVDPFFLTL